MHAHLDEVLPLLDNSRAVLKSAVDGVPENLRRTRPAHDRWSVAEVLEHLVKVNRFFAERIATRGLMMLSVGLVVSAVTATVLIGIRLSHGFSAPGGLETKRRMLELEGAPGFGQQALFG